MGRGEPSLQLKKIVLLLKRQKNSPEKPGIHPMAPAVCRGCINRKKICKTKQKCPATTNRQLQGISCGAGYGARTRHLLLGKQTLYQMS